MTRDRPSCVNSEHYANRVEGGKKRRENERRSGEFILYMFLTMSYYERCCEMWPFLVFSLEFGRRLNLKKYGMTLTANFFK